LSWLMSGLAEELPGFLLVLGVAFIFPGLEQVGEGLGGGWRLKLLNSQVPSGGRIVDWQRSGYRSKARCRLGNALSKEFGEGKPFAFVKAEELAFEFLNGHCYCRVGMPLALS
jgi:hypothetical protein